MKNVNLLINPFVRIAGGKALILGLIISLLTAVIGTYSMVLYPAVLDVKLVPDIDLVNAICYVLVSILVIGVVGYLFSFFFAKGVRFIDVLGTMALARLALLPTAFLGFFTNMQDLELMEAAMRQQNQGSASSFATIIVLGILMLPFVIWYIALLYNAYKVSTGVKSGKMIGCFIATIIVSEVLSIVANIALTKALA